MMKINTVRKSKKAQRQEVLDWFVKVALRNLDASNGEPTDMEIEIPRAIDDNELWYSMDELSRENGFRFNVNEKNERFDPTYYYGYLTKRKED